MRAVKYGLLCFAATIAQPCYASEYICYSYFYSSTNEDEQTPNRAQRVVISAPFEFSSENREDVEAQFNREVANEYSISQSGAVKTACRDNWYDPGASQRRVQARSQRIKEGASGKDLIEVSFLYDPDWRNSQGNRSAQTDVGRGTSQSQRDRDKDESYGYCIWQYSSVVSPKKSRALISDVFLYKDNSLFYTVNQAWTNYVLANYDVSGNGVVCFDAGKTSYEEAVSIRDGEQAKLKGIWKTVIATGWRWNASASSARASTRPASTPANRRPASTGRNPARKPAPKRR